MPDRLTPVITGPATKPYRVEYQEGDQWFGVRLRPEHGAMLWQRELGQASDNVLRGPDALACLPALSALRGKVLTLDTLVHAIPLQTWPDVDQRLSKAVDTLHASGGRLRIDVLAKFVACTSRHLNRLFRRHNGLSAKIYAQLIQFHRALHLVQLGKVPVIAAAFEAGYSDHAHMVRAFQRFGGFTPSTIPANLSLPDLLSR